MPVSSLLPPPLLAALDAESEPEEARARVIEALTHPTWANERRDATGDNQRLELLGDAVLELIVTETLFFRLPHADEGLLSRARAAAVNEAALADAARRIELGAALRLGRGEDASGGRERAPILADAFEALIAATYLWRGPAAARRLVELALGDAIESAIDAATHGKASGGVDARAKDPKSLLQEHAQRGGGATPVYEIESAEGPDHDRSYVVRVLVAGEPLGRGRGRARREAERAAAVEALAALAARKDESR